jgi:hypothetical protein
MKLRTCARGVPLLAVLLLTACGDGLSHGRVRREWQALAAEDPRCANVTVTDAEVMGISYREDMADAVVRVKGRWTGPRGQDLNLGTLAGLMGSPCGAFDSGKAEEQEITTHVYFRKYDTGWQRGLIP